MPVRRCFRMVLLLFAVLCLTVTAAFALAEESPFAAEVTVPGLGTVSIPLQQTEEGKYLFLPSAVRLDALVLRFSEDSATLSGEKGSVTVKSGEPFSLLPLLNGEGESCVLSFDSGGDQVAFTLMHSSALRSAYLVSGSEKKGRSYVEADKDRKVKGVSFALLRQDGSAVWSGVLKNIKGRGNSTWHYPKKPYQIKLTEKADLLETGDKAERESTWILLANYIDESLLRNQISFDLAAEFQLPYTPHCVSVDLYYDGEYRGVYLLCEKTEISRGRVAIRDLEEEIEAANPDVSDFEKLTWAEGKLRGGLVYRYYPDLASPEDIRGGYLLELDYGPRAVAEASWFCTENGQYVTVKSPEYMPEDGMRYIASLYQRFERAVFAGGTDPETGADYRELCDLDSLARCFLLMELAKDNDAFLSSTYFYKPEGEEKLYAGPVWDFDTGYGVADLPEDISVTGRTVLGSRLLHIPSFREALMTCWTELKPLLSDIVLSSDPRSAGTRLRSLAAYGEETAASRRMDRAMWGRSEQDESVRELGDFLRERIVWMENELTLWYAGDVPYCAFMDVQEGQWFYDSVGYAVERGLFNGVSALQFEPYRNISRAMIVSVLHRMLGSPESGRSGGFRDVNPAAWYAEAVDWAAETGITGGVGENRFAPGAAVTREQMISLLYRTLQHAGIRVEGKAELSGFSDAEQISPWAWEAMSWAVDSGILVGNKGCLDPQGDTTRAQAAAIIARAYQIYFDPMLER